MLFCLQQNRDQLDLHFVVTDFFYDFSPTDWTDFSNPQTVADGHSRDVCDVTSDQVACSCS